MKLDFIKNLQELHGEQVVFHDGKSWIFCMNDDLMVSEEAHDEFIEKYGTQFDDEDLNVYGSLGYGDDTINAVVIKDISKVDDSWLEEFLQKYTGENCYTREEEEEDYEDDEE